MKILESAEDYLEAMLILQQKNGYIRSIDIAERMGVTKPSVSYAVKRLRENGYLTMEENGHISLTPDGLSIAERIYERHKLLISFFTALGVPEEIALEDACKIEHDLSETSFRAICQHMKQIG